MLERLQLAHVETQRALGSLRNHTQAAALPFPHPSTVTDRKFRTYTRMSVDVTLPPWWSPRWLSIGLATRRNPAFC